MPSSNTVVAALSFILVMPCYSQSLNEAELSRALIALKSRISSLESSIAALESKVTDNDRRIAQLEKNLSDFGKYEVNALLNGSVDERLLNLERALQKKRALDKRN
jgi:septal ring factor EnvC (AmiA/AmiB activator)